jgi:hypothetical protein
MVGYVYLYTTRHDVAECKRRMVRGAVRLRTAAIRRPYRRNGSRGNCFVDLFQGDALIRQVARHAGGWTPPPGTWAQVGEQIRYPQEHFCQRRWRALTRSSSPACRGTGGGLPGAQRPVHGVSQGGGAEIGPCRAAVCPRGAARRDEPGPVGPDRQHDVRQVVRTGRLRPNGGGQWRAVAPARPEAGLGTRHEPVLTRRPQLFTSPASAPHRRSITSPCPYPSLQTPRLLFNSRMPALQ